VGRQIGEHVSDLALELGKAPLQFQMRVDARPPAARAQA
jgi:hypothetical protein